MKIWTNNKIKIKKGRRLLEGYKKIYLLDEIYDDLIAKWEFIVRKPKLLSSIINL